VDDLQPHVRLEPPPSDDVLLLRGGEDTVPKLRRHAERTHRAFTLDGSPVYGLSVFCALDELAQRQLYRRLAAYPLLRASSVGRVRGAGFRLLPTFTRPHFTVALASVETEELARLLACFDPPSHNPRYGHRRRRL
jgi:hypothetical protein